MTDATNEPLGIEQEWREPAPSRKPSRVPVVVRRLFVAALVIIAIAALVILLFRNYSRQRTCLVALHAAGLRPLNGPAGPLAGKEMDLFAGLDGAVTYKTPTDNDHPFQSPLELKRWLNKNVRVEGDTLIVYLAAHGVEVEGTPYLICDNFDPANPSSGRCPLEDVISIVQSSLAKTKLLILDAGSVEYEPELGIVANEFASAVKSVVPPDESFLVLCSHDDLQKSRFSADWGGSIFGFVVAAGLRGNADRESNNDGKITVDELVTYVKIHFQLLIKDSNGTANQTPVFCEPVRKNATANGKEDTANGKEDTIVKKKHDQFLLDLSELSPDVRNGDLKSLVESARKQQRQFRDSSFVPTENARGYLARISSDKSGNAAVTPVSQSAQSIGAERSNQTEASKKGDGSTEAKSERETPDPRQQIHDLLTKAWRILDQFTSESGGAHLSLNTPVDSTPHLWRELIEELVAYEQAIAGSTIGNVPSVEHLTQAVNALSAMKVGMLTEGRTEAKSSSSTAILNNVAPQTLAATIRSLAMAELIATRFGTPDTKQVAELRSVVNGLIDAPPDELAQRISKLQATPELKRYYELRLATQLGDVVSSQPALAQLALQVRNKGERVAAGSWATVGWLGVSIHEADRRRLAGERQILDQIGSDWPSRARRELEAADQCYDAVIHDCIDITQAIQLRDELTFRARYYLRLLRARALTAKEGEEKDLNDSIGQTQSVLAKLIEFSDHLDQPSPMNIDQVKRLDRQIRAEIGGSAANDGWQLPANGPNGRINGDISSLKLLVEDALTGNSKAISRVVDQTSEVSKSLLEKRLVKMCQLEGQLAQLTTIVGSPDRAKLIESIKKLQESASDQDMLSNFATLFSEVYGRLPQRLKVTEQGPDPLTVAKANQNVNSARRALQLISARDASDFREMRIDVLRQNIEIFNLLTLQAARFNQASKDALSNDSVYLADATDQYYSLAEKIYDISGLNSSTTSPLTVNAANEVSLVAHSAQSVPILLSYSGLGTVDAWVVVEYDPALIEVTGPNVYREPHLANRFPYCSDQEILKKTPTLSGIASGHTSHVDLAIQSKPGAARVAKLIVRAVAAQPQTVLPNSKMQRATVDATSQLMVAIPHPIRIPVRVFDLVLEGAPDTWRQQDDHFVLQTLPNASTNYRFGVRNSGNADREILLRLFPAPANLNVDTISVPDTQRSLSQLSPLGQMTLTALADGKIHYASSSAAPAPAVVPPTNKELSKVTAAADDRTKLPAGPMLDSGIVVEVSDPKDPAQLSYKKFDIVVQRPRHYVRPQVAYNSRLERIEVMVRPRSNSVLPGQSVRVSCDVADDVDTAAEGKLNDVITAPDYQANLFVNIPADPPRDVTLYINVDDYPRAFIYRVPCGSGVIDLAEDTGASEIRLRTADQSEFRAPAAVTPVIAQVDAPVGAFELGDDNLRTALDENMDHLFGPERGTRFDKDRQANSYFGKLDPNGTLSVETRVSDFIIPLNTRSLQNVAIQVNGQSTINGHHALAQPLTLNIDGVGPKIESLDISPWGGFVVAGTDLNVTIVANDTMSGVKQVQVGFDVERNGKFSEKVPPISAVLAARDIDGVASSNLLNVVRQDRTDDSSIERRSQTWMATVPTKDIQGVQTLLIRAVDRVGNSSEYYSKRVQVLTAEEATEEIKQRTKTIEGIVVFRDSPVPNAQVALFAIPDNKEQAASKPSPVAAAAQATKESEKQVALTKTDENGAYSIGGIAPGKYRVSAEGLIRDKPRFGQQPTAVELSPGNIVRADLQIE